MVRTSRCGRDNPGSTPGQVIIVVVVSPLRQRLRSQNGGGRSVASVAAQHTRTRVAPILSRDKRIHLVMLDIYRAELHQPRIELGTFSVLG